MVRCLLLAWSAERGPFRIPVPLRGCKIFVSQFILQTTRSIPTSAAVDQTSLLFSLMQGNSQSMSDSVRRD
jgi:hypothetical protein